MHPHTTTTSDTRFWAKVDRFDPDGCWPWTGAKSGGGYGAVVRLGRMWTASRWSYVLTHGDIPEGLFVCHRCDNPLCCRPDHLFLGTPQQNAADMMQKGRHGSAKLTEEQVREVRRIYAAGMQSQTALAKVYGVNHGTICAIVQGSTWQQVGGPITKIGQGGWQSKHPESRARGERNPSARLTAMQVKEIRILDADGISKCEISRRYGVSQRTIALILRRDTWKDIA